MDNSALTRSIDDAILCSQAKTLLHLMPDYKYFSESEFNALTPSCSLSDMDPDFMRALDAARHISGIPFVLNCAFRSVEWDKSKGRPGTSFHTKGMAVDIRCGDSKKRASIIFSLWLCGIKGIGVYDTFIHADFRSDPILFLGKK